MTNGFEFTAELDREGFYLLDEAASYEYDDDTDFAELYTVAVGDLMLTRTSLVDAFGEAEVAEQEASAAVFYRQTRAETDGCNRYHLAAG